jgi:hypothetical protein
MEFLLRSRDDARTSVIDRQPHAPILITLPCQGESHRIRWDRGRVQFLDHALPALKLELALEVDRRTACGEVLYTLRTADGEVPDAADPLFNANDKRRSIRGSYGRGARPAYPGFLQYTLCQAIASRIAAPMLAALEAEGLRADLVVDQGAAEEREFRFKLQTPDTQQRLLSFRLDTHAWTAASHQELHRIARERSMSLTAGTWTDGSRCRVCQMGQVHPPALQPSKHARQIAHRDRVVAAFERAIYHCYQAHTETPWYRNIQGLAANFETFLWRMRRELGPRLTLPPRVLSSPATQLALIDTR